MAEIIKSWQTKSGYKAKLLLMSMGHICGYVGIPKGHILFGKGYSENIPELKPLYKKALKGNIGKRGAFPIFISMLQDKKDKKMSMEIIFDVHGSVTFSGGDEKYFEPELWWIGFDTAHAGDSPEKQNEEYCTIECENLAEQLKEVEKYGKRKLQKKIYKSN
jgi:hypothetical protein